MSLFRCEKCGAVDNTAIRNKDGMNMYYGVEWPDSSRRHRLMTGKWECYECRNGKWHKRFAKRQWDPTIKVINPDE